MLEDIVERPDRRRFLGTLAIAAAALFFDIDAEAKPAPAKNRYKVRPTLYDKLGYRPSKQSKIRSAELAPKNTDIGRIQRTLRWQPIYRKVERKYGIPQDTLAGMIMEESYGDPLQPNSTNDGGFGLVHIQGNVAKSYGLRILGDSKKSTDKKHGADIRQMLDDCEKDIGCVQKQDERAHLLKVLDTAGRILREGKEKYGSWVYAIQYYRGPGHVKTKTGWEYFQNVSGWKDVLHDAFIAQKAVEDFNKRNSCGQSVMKGRRRVRINCSFPEYLRSWHATANDWGLGKYR